MPKMSSYRRIITNDFEEEDRDLVGQLSTPINYSFNELYFALNGRLTLRDNLFSTVKDVDIYVNSNGTPVNTTSFALDKTGSILGCSVLSAVNQDNTSVFPTGQPFISFTQNNNSIFINHITGLTPGYRWTIRVVAFLT